ncbi:MAG: VCBS repeat-containing protein, partial [Saprospiraceae bacterium]|nr:VCBS repeat-containing protein [Saprospiraceae bacterium]
NSGDGTFRDVTAAWGLDLELYGMGIAVGDYDGDGDDDLFLAALGPDHLLRNDGLRFTDVTESAGAAVRGADDGYSSSAGFFDADGDGDLDLLVLEYVVWSAEADRAQSFTLAGLDRAYGPPDSFAGAVPRLLRNDGDGRFTDASAEAGLTADAFASGIPKSLGLVFADLDGDRCLDVIVASDTTPNLLLANHCDG